MDRGRFNCSAPRFAEGAGEAAGISDKHCEMKTKSVATTILVLPGIPSAAAFRGLTPNLSPPSPELFSHTLKPGFLHRDLPESLCHRYFLARARTTRSYHFSHTAEREKRGLKLPPAALATRFLLYCLSPQPSHRENGNICLACLEKEIESILLVADGVYRQALDVNTPWAVHHSHLHVAGPAVCGGGQQVAQGLVVDLQVGDPHSDEGIDGARNGFEDLQKEKRMEVAGLVHQKNSLWLFRGAVWDFSNSSALIYG